MKVYLEPPTVKSFSLRRVASALRQYAPPEIEVVDHATDADLVVLHVIGRCEKVHDRAYEILESGRRYAAVQYCLRSTQRSDTSEWVWLWEKAKLVWSYYDLPQLCWEDGEPPPSMNFYHAPLGAHSSVFYDRLNLNGNRPYLTLTHGQSWLTEGVREVVLATGKVGKKAFHLGEKCYRGEHVAYGYNLDDNDLAATYSKVQYVCPLRRVEGFELPAVEGLLCGARPVLYDRAHYRHWYGDWAEYVREQSRQLVLDQLVQLFERPYRRVTPSEIAAAALKFSWPTIVGDFWGRILDA